MQSSLSLATDKLKRGLGIGLSGAHRTGKTTLGQSLAEQFGTPFVTSSASAIAAKLGVNVGPNMEERQRRIFQEAILEDFTLAYRKLEGEIFVTDRTPLDLAAYAMVDWNGSQTTEHEEWLVDYVGRCLEVTSTHFFSVSVVQPGIKYVSAEGKPAINEAYQEAMNTTVIGLAHAPELRSHSCVLRRTTTDNSTRVDLLDKWVDRKLTAETEDLHEKLSLQ